MPEVRLIDANALKKAFCDYCSAIDTDMLKCTGNCDTLRIIDEQPTIKPEVLHPTVSTDPERKHGHWIMMDADRAKCSVCGWWQKSNGKDKTGEGLIFSACYHYCTACGARMDGGAEMRLIDADALMEKVCGDCPGNDCTQDATDTVYGCMLAESVEEAPTIEPEVRHGRWIKLPESCQADYECSECGAGIGKLKMPYCAICGAKMYADGGIISLIDEEFTPGLIEEGL